ncbi:MAG: UDP-N-acetylmuramoyl-tripeptide--D-alanyl-D-alanine ligase [Candidatus Aenigmarchaeota archaeon]|nr:UDP-N-acetylmuramoyl-tripeptide--D-alanyl-D-alanine ligase [Candidatus Aenigmarchaeota archaeon]
MPLIKLYQYILAYLAKQVIKKYRPMVIGITGSIGKSTTKEAIKIVLDKFFPVRASYSNYNNEIGMPLSILNVRLSKHRLRNLWRIIRQSWRLLVGFDKNYPSILILEMAADHPGDLSYLTSIARPDLAVLTAITPSHLQFFSNLEGVAKEKTTIIRNLASNGWAIINIDDLTIKQYKEKIETKILTFGLSEQADVRAKEIYLDQKLLVNKQLKIKGLGFKLSYRGTTIPVYLPKVVARHHLYSVLAGIAVGLVSDLKLLDICEALKKYQPIDNRLTLKEGINQSIILDDTYNSSPKAAKAALTTLAELGDGYPVRRWAILGDMLELGNYTEEEHWAVGKLVAKLKIDFLVVIGEQAKIISRAAKTKGFPIENIFIFNDLAKAGKLLQEELIKNDLVLIKASRAFRLEKLVEMIVK